MTYISIPILLYLHFFLPTKTSFLTPTNTYLPSQFSRSAYVRQLPASKRHLKILLYILYTVTHQINLYIKEKYEKCMYMILLPVRLPTSMYIVLIREKLLYIKKKILLIAALQIHRFAAGELCIFNHPRKVDGTLNI